MSRKQSYEPMNSSKKYQVTSPYIQLLQAKKKQYVYHYGRKSIGSFTNCTKPSGALISSLPTQHSKPSAKDRARRSRTQQQNMHESLSVYPSTHHKTIEASTSKSLYDVQPKLSNELDSNLNQQPLQQNKKKRYQSCNKHNSSLQHNHSNPITSSLENLNIQDIDGLLSLIQNCVNQANQYISYLSQQLSIIKQQLTLTKDKFNKVQQQIYVKNMQIAQRNKTISQLQKQLNKNKSDIKNGHEQSQYKIKNLLQFISKINQQNQQLKSQLKQYKNNNSTIQQNQNQQKPNQNIQDPRRDYYHQIHNKIDILNISIDNNHTFNHNEEDADGKDKKGRDISKKYKFIKPKAR